MNIKWHMYKDIIFSRAIVEIRIRSGCPYVALLSGLRANINVDVTSRSETQRPATAACPDTQPGHGSRRQVLENEPIHSPTVDSMQAMFRLVRGVILHDQSTVHHPPAERRLVLAECSCLHESTQRLRTQSNYGTASGHWQHSWLGFPPATMSRHQSRSDISRLWRRTRR